MNFEFGEDQELLREQARGFLAEHCPPAAVRAVLDGDVDHDAELWQKIVEMGWTATVIPEEYGGLGLSYLELVVIAEELGRAAAPVPFSSSVYLATEALMICGTQEQKEKWLPLLAAGEAIGTFALSEGNGRPSVKSLNTKLTDGGLSGRKLPVADGRAADFAVVVAASDSGDGASWYLVELEQDGVSREAVRTLDFSRGHAVVEFANAMLNYWQCAGWGRLTGCLTWLLCLRLGAGWSGRCRDDSGARLRHGTLCLWSRHRFLSGDKHKLANMYVKHLARSNCYYGAWALNTDSAELPLAAATARVGAIKAAVFAAEENVQTHGGMGFTWEFDCQFYYRRAKLLGVNVGSEGYWQDRLITAYEQNNAA